MRTIVHGLVYWLLLPLAVLAAGAIAVFLPSDYSGPVGWGFTALFAGLTISELREQLSGRLSELMLKHVEHPSHFRTACQTIARRQRDVRRWALLGGLFNTIGACIAIVLANMPSPFDRAPMLYGICGTLLALGLFVHFWLSTALSEVESLFISILKDEASANSRDEFLETTKSSLPHDFAQDETERSGGMPPKRLSTRRRGAR